MPRVVIVGGGFGGIQCAKKLRGTNAEVVLVDRHNYHLFTPLLYQVASCLLNPSEIAAPLRKVFRNVPNVRVRVGDVDTVDYDNKTVHFKTVHFADGETLAYDCLVLAAGSHTNYFGNDDIEKYALGLKDLGEALQLRNHVLDRLERAAATTDAAERARLLSFCVVGGGPTGVEYAGALAELVRLVLPAEYPEIPEGSVRIMLFEGGERVLSTFAPRLSQYAQNELERRGVEVHTKRLLRDPAELDGAALIWAAGVRPSELTETRVDVDEHFRVPGRAGVYAIGDLARARDRNGRELPMTSPPAMQAGRHVARHIRAQLDGERVRPFRYVDKGNMATIGRTSAVAEIGPLRLTGFVGWIAWLVVHLYYLIGFENRLQVMLRWAWYYLRYDRPVRSNIRARPDAGNTPSP